MRKQAEWLRVTLASIGDAVISTDADGRVIFLNSVAEALTGWSQPEAAGRPLPAVFDIVNEVTRLPVDNPALRALRDGTIVGLANHTVLVARDGTERPIDDSAAPIRDEGGAVLGAVLVFRDVSERRRAEEDRARLAAIVDSSEDAIISKTLDGSSDRGTPGRNACSATRPARPMGRTIALIIPPERQDEERAILDRLRRGERVDHFETVRVAKGGRRIDISLTISPVRGGDGRVIGASKIARDITERKAAEEERRRLQDEVEAERARLAEVFRRAPSFLAILRGPEHVFDLANEPYDKLIGGRDIVGKPIREALPEVEGQGFFELLDEVYRTGEAFVGTDMRVLVQRKPGPAARGTVRRVRLPAAPRGRRLGVGHPRPGDRPHGPQACRGGGPAEGREAPALPRQRHRLRHHHDRPRGPRPRMEGRGRADHRLARGRDAGGDGGETSSRPRIVRPGSPRRRWPGPSSTGGPRTGAGT